jgi:hypothetical protein
MKAYLRLADGQVVEVRWASGPWHWNLITAGKHWTSDLHHRRVGRHEKADSPG